MPRKWQLVFGENEPCTGLHVVAAGHVRIFRIVILTDVKVLEADLQGA
jgi:hypothetical protein